MKPLYLKSKIAITGPDFFGRKARLILWSTEEDGWFWKPSGQKPILITPEIVEHNTRRVMLKNGKHQLNVCEHLGALRIMGLDRVIIESTAWPPYHGRSSELWEAVAQNCVRGSSDMRWQTVKRMVKYQCPGRWLRYTRIEPSDEQCLEIVVFSKYPGLTEVKSGYYKFPDKMFLKKTFKIQTQGWPPMLYLVSRTASILGWPHHNKIIWPQEHSSKETIELFTLHRLLDLLGALAFLFSPGILLSAKVTSYCSGHKADVRALKQAYKVGLRPTK